MIDSASRYRRYKCDETVYNKTPDRRTPMYVIQITDGDSSQVALVPASDPDDRYAIATARFITDAMNAAEAPTKGSWVRPIVGGQRMRVDRRALYTGGVLLWVTRENGETTTIWAHDVSPSPQRCDGVVI